MKLLFSLALVVVTLSVVGVVAFVALGGSGSNDSNDAASSGAATPVSSPSTPVAGLTADEVLQQASAAANEVTSFHFVLSHENGSTPLPLSLALEAAEGDILVPASMAAEVDAEAAGINVTVRVIGIDDRTWITNPFTRQWQELPNTNIRDFADPAALVSGLLPSITGEGVGGGGRVDGVETHLVTGSIESEALRDALGIAEPGRSVTVEAWIGVDDLLPRRIRLTGPLTDDESPGVVRQVEISRYDEPVEIMPPD